MSGTYAELPQQPVGPLQESLAIKQFTQSRNEWAQKSFLGKLIGTLFGSKKYLVLENDTTGIETLACRTLKLGERPTDLLDVRKFCQAHNIQDNSLKPYYSDALYHSLTSTSFHGMRSAPRWSVPSGQIIELGKASQPQSDAPATPLVDWKTKVSKFGLNPAQIAVQQYVKKLEARESSLFQRIFTPQPELVLEDGVLLCRERSFFDRTRDTANRTATTEDTVRNAIDMPIPDENAYVVGRAYIQNCITQRDSGSDNTYALVDNVLRMLLNPDPSNVLVTALEAFPSPGLGGQPAIHTENIVNKCMNELLSKKEVPGNMARFLQLLSCLPPTKAILGLRKLDDRKIQECTPDERATLKNICSEMLQEVYKEPEGFMPDSGLQLGQLPIRRDELITEIIEFLKRPSIQQNPPP